ncbi:MAG: AraC family transcriptional regulator [Firmicutes bacterium HGW-Firmicutes-15]|nr:MAG: AraC family transcriptional regulator [Firmicutes bacterium HGW-Firmicutes-15]
MNYQFEFLEKAAQLVISVRTRSSVENLPQVLGGTYGLIMNYLNEIGAEPAGAPFVGYFNMDMQDLDIEVGFPVAKPLADKGELKSSEIPAGPQVSCMHIGPYNQVESAYNAIMEWIAANGHTSTGVCYEFYLNDPANTPESELLTKIVFMLK